MACLLAATGLVVADGRNSKDINNPWDINNPSSPIYLNQGYRAYLGSGDAWDLAAGNFLQDNGNYIGIPGLGLYANWDNYPLYYPLFNPTFFAINNSYPFYSPVIVTSEATVPVNAVYVIDNHVVAYKPAQLNGLDLPVDSSGFPSHVPGQQTKDGIVIFGGDCRKGYVLIKKT